MSKASSKRTRIATAVLSFVFVAVVWLAAPGAAHAQGGQEDVQAPVKQFPKVLAAEVKTANGIVNGTLGEDGTIRIYRGIPFAAPPVGDLRWREPQPAANWTGVRDGSEFGARCMQTRVYADMVFRDILDMALNNKIPPLEVMYAFGGAIGMPMTEKDIQEFDRLYADMRDLICEHNCLAQVLLHVCATFIGRTVDVICSHGLADKEQLMESIRKIIEDQMNRTHEFKLKSAAGTH